MRVLSTLSLLCLSALGVSSQSTTFVFNAASTQEGQNPGYIINGFNGTSPALSFIAGNSYAFDLSAVPNHPFNFTSVAASGINIVPLDPTYYTLTATPGCNNIVNKGWAATPATSNSSATTCIVTLNIQKNAPLEYPTYTCTVHTGMSGPTTVTPAADAPTTPAPTTPAPTTPAPTTPAPTGPLPGQTLTGSTFSITGAQDTSAYIFSANGKKYADPTLQIQGGSTVKISLDFQNDLHPFGFSLKGNTDAVQLTTDYFPADLNTGYALSGVCATTPVPNSQVTLIRANTTSSCIITLQVPQQTTKLYYRCGKHAAMVGTINIVGNTGVATVAGAGMAMLLAIIATLIM